MSICLIGSTSEPVITNSTTSVAATTIASISGRWSARLALRSMKPRGRRRSTSAPAVERPQLVDEVLARLAEGRIGGDHLHDALAVVERPAAA